MSDIVAIICARSGSKGLRNKNLAKLDGETLIGRCVRLCVESNAFKEVWVSTDGEDIAEEVRKNGGFVHKRMEHTSTDRATTLSGIQEFMQHHPDVKYFANLQCTCPLVKPQYMWEAAQQMKEKDYDSIFAVVRTNDIRWTASGQPVNVDLETQHLGQGPPDYYLETGMFYMTKRELLEQNLLQGGKTGMYEVPQRDAIDIDTLHDLVVAEALIKHRKSVTNGAKVE